MKISTLDFIVPRLQAIQANPKFENFSNYSFLFPKSLVTNSILFIGINPSLNKENFLLDSYDLSHRDNKHPYFKKMENISSYCNTDWTHLDLFYFRETKQDIITDILKQPNGVAFLWEQLQITDTLIRESKPKIIVVCNALAGTFLGKDKDIKQNKNVWLGYDFYFDDKLGTYRWKNIPVFFSGMLSGQRALDKGSFERLQWHIKKALTDNETKS
jgi:hypothetical protein